jgi:hypothetical protein
VVTINFFLYLTTQQTLKTCCNSTYSLGAGEWPFYSKESVLIYHSVGSRAGLKTVKKKKKKKKKKMPAAAGKRIPVLYFVF